MEWHGGDVSGILPYSRLAGSPGDVRAEEPTEIFVIPRTEIPALIRECYELTAIFVHVMVDRARLFTSSDLHDEKMSSLGKLAAGLAHELNNPASAVARSAKGLRLALSELEAASRALGAARLSEAQQAAVDRARGFCLAAAGATFGRSPIERADREDALADWLARHGADVERPPKRWRSPRSRSSPSTTLAGRSDRRGAPGDPPAGSWPAARRTSSRREIETAATRIHNLVAAVKGFTYMDQAAMPKPVDVAPGAGRHARGAQREGPREVRERDPRRRRPTCRASRASGASSTRCGRTSSTTRWTRPGAAWSSTASRRGRIRRRARRRRRAGTARGDPRAHLRSVLHDEAGRPGHRPRPRHRAPDRPASTRGTSRSTPAPGTPSSA